MYVAGPADTASASTAGADPANDATSGTTSPSGPSAVHVQKCSGTESTELGGAGECSGTASLAACP